VLCAVLVLVVVLSRSRSHPSASLSSSPVGPPLASLAGEAQGQVVGGIPCLTKEQVLFHIHAHLAVFVDGQPRGIPAGIGIPGAEAESTSFGPVVVAGKCFYWLHSHTADGVIHIESPVRQIFTLGNYFDIWGQPLDSGHIGPVAGLVTAYRNGQPVGGSPRDIPLDAHALIQLDVGANVAPKGFTFEAGL
jgi:hypothetical protein